MASSNQHKCKHNPNSFCYICGCYTLVRQRPNITNFVKLAFNCILNLVTKTNIELYILCAIFMKKVFEIGQKEKERIYLLESPWFGENH